MDEGKRKKVKPNQLKRTKRPESMNGMACTSWISIQNFPIFGVNNHLGFLIANSFELTVKFSNFQLMGNENWLEKSGGNLQCLTEGRKIQGNNFWFKLLGGLRNRGLQKLDKNTLQHQAVNISSTPTKTLNLKLYCIISLYKLILTWNLK